MRPWHTPLAGATLPSLVRLALRYRATTLRFEHIVALATLHGRQLPLEAGLQDGVARGALELEGRLSHRSL